MYARPFASPIASAGKLLAAMALAGALTLPVAAKEVHIVDDTGQALTLAQPARRIVSLAPHVTELLFAAGAGAQVVGVVEYSDYPEAARTLPRVGGYSNIDLEAVAALKPDLVIGWKSGNRDGHLERITALGIPVYLNEPRSLDHVARSLERFGELAGHPDSGKAAAQTFRERQQTLGRRFSTRPRVRTFYQIWDRPLMTINDEHLISDVIRLCGGENVFGSQRQLAPTLGVEGVLAANPEVIVASGMGDARPDWLNIWKRWPALAATARDNLFFVPPELIQRHTPRILDGAAMLCEQLETARSRRNKDA